MNYFHDMVDNIHQKRIWRPWNQCGSICLHLRRHIWNLRTSVIGTRWNSRLNKGQTCIKQAKNIPTTSKNIPTCWSTDSIHHSCVELAIFMGKDSVHLKFNFKHTAWSTSLSPREADDAGLAQFDFTRAVSRKNWHEHFRVEAIAILATKIAWWHGNGDCGCSRFKL